MTVLPELLQGVLESERADNVADLLCGVVECLSWLAFLSSSSSFCILLLSSLISRAISPSKSESGDTAPKLQNIKHSEIKYTYISRVEDNTETSCFP